MIGQALARLSLAMLPPRCLVCGERGCDDRDLCRDCTAALPWNRCACPRCGLPRAPGVVTCAACRQAPPALDATQAAFVYGFPVDRLLPRFKFHADLAAGRLLAGLLADACRTAPRPAALVPVPLHLGRLRERGYDQALELAKALSRSLSLPLLDQALVRTRATRAQSELGATARRRNLQSAFALRPGPLPAHVALVDDVMTTGATLDECARLLKAAGVARVEAWVVARAPSPGELLDRARPGAASPA